MARRISQLSETSAKRRRCDMRRSPFAEHFHGDDEDEEEDLAVDAGTQEGAADPAIEAEVDEGGEGPDFFLVNEAAVDAGGDGDGEQERESEEFSVQDGGQREHGCADEGGAGTDEDAEKDGGLERDIGGVEVGDGDADPHAEAERDTDEGQETESLAEGTVVTEEEVLKFAGAPERGGDSRGYTELDEQGDEDEARIGHGFRVQGSAGRVQERVSDASRFYNRGMAIASVRKVADADFPTRWGHFRILGFEGIYADDDPARCGQTAEKEEAVALVMGDVHAVPPLVRIHSQCLTGDVFHSLRCDCRLQLELSLKKIAEAGAGIVIYEQQEGRGIGLMAKLRAYELQDQGLDTVEANIRLGFEADCREFELPAEILRQMGVESVRLITNNPDKVAALEAAGVRVAERVSAEVPTEDSFEQYLRVKQEKMGHIFESIDEPIR